MVKSSLQGEFFTSQIICKPGFVSDRRSVPCQPSI